MRINTILRYTEVLLIIGAILSPIIFYTTPLSIMYRYTSVDLKEGDIIQVTINDYAFNYQIKGLESYNVTAGIYLYPIFKLEDVISTTAGSIQLLEGNLTSVLELNFRVDAITKSIRGTSYANVTLEETGDKFILNTFLQPAITPFVLPYLAHGLTITAESEIRTVEYVCWHSIYLFSTQNTREALNWHSRNSGYLGYDFAKEDTNTFKTVLNDDYSGYSFFSLTTWVLKDRSNKLQGVASAYDGYEQLTLYDSMNYPRFFNFTTAEDIFSYWNYNMDIEIKYFRGGKEL